MTKQMTIVVIGSLRVKDYVNLLFAGEIQKKGIVIPLAREFYHPILVRLQQEGINSRELIETH